MAAEDGGPAPVVTEAPAREGWKQRIYVPTLLAGSSADLFVKSFDSIFHLYSHLSNI